MVLDNFSKEITTPMTTPKSNKQHAKDNKKKLSASGTPLKQGTQKTHLNFTVLTKEDLEKERITAYSYLL